MAFAQMRQVRYRISATTAAKPYAKMSSFEWGEAVINEPVIRHVGPNNIYHKTNGKPLSSWTECTQTHTDRFVCACALCVCVFSDAMRWKLCTADRMTRRWYMMPANTTTMMNDANRKRLWLYRVAKIVQSLIFKINKIRNFNKSKYQNCLWVKIIFHSYTHPLMCCVWAS